jgi:ABC-type polysaccharide transport system permease subunit
MGYQSIVYMASISGIDKSIYEAAAIDAADFQNYAANVKTDGYHIDLNVDWKNFLL